MDLFTLGSTSKRPDSERLLYQSSSQVLRPPTAPLTPNAPPTQSGGGETIYADPWFMPATTVNNEEDGLPPIPSQPPPPLNLFESLNSPINSDPESDYWNTDARLNHIVDYLQKRTPNPFNEWTPTNDNTDEDDAFTPFSSKRANRSPAPRSPKPPSSCRSRNSPMAQARAPVKGWWKTEICKFWKESGGCRNEKNCRWAHGAHELRSPSPEPGDSTTGIVQPWTVVTDCSNALQQVWELLKMKNQFMKQVEENCLIAGPGANIILDDEYWKQVGEILLKTPSDVCRTCGEIMDPASETDIAKIPLACATCVGIAMEKIHTMSLVPPSSSQQSPSHNDRKKLVHWGLSLASLLKNIDELMWIPNAETASLSQDFQTPISDWVRHKRAVARAILIMRCYIESLPNNRRTRLLTTELLPSLSLVDWSVVSNQPILYISLMANGFPIQLTLPSNIPSHKFNLKKS